MIILLWISNEGLLPPPVAQRVSSACQYLNRIWVFSTIWILCYWLVSCPCWSQSLRLGCTPWAPPLLLSWDHLSSQVPYPTPPRLTRAPMWSQPVSNSSLCPLDSLDEPIGPRCMPSCSYNCVRACVLSRFIRVRLFVTLWIAALQAPLSMGFSRQEHWSGLPCPPSAVY